MTDQEIRDWLTNNGFDQNGGRARAQSIAEGLAAAGNPDVTTERVVAAMSVLDYERLGQPVD